MRNENSYNFHLHHFFRELNILPFIFRTLKSNEPPIWRDWRVHCHNLRCYRTIVGWMGEEQTSLVCCNVQRSNCSWSRLLFATWLRRVSPQGRCPRDKFFSHRSVIEKSCRKVEKSVESQLKKWGKILSEKKTELFWFYLGACCIIEEKVKRRKGRSMRRREEWIIKNEPKRLIGGEHV